NQSTIKDCLEEIQFFLTLASVFGIVTLTIQTQLVVGWSLHFNRVNAMLPMFYAIGQDRAKAKALHDMGMLEKDMPAEEFPKFTWGSFFTINR
ncbi:hypothetical protein AVEN_272931-1, partial [Araneus ventricosus]